MVDIKTVVETSEIKEKRSIVKVNREYIAYLKSKMIELERFKKVKQYKKYILRLKELSSNYSKKHMKEIRHIRNELKRLEEDERVLLYKSCYNEVCFLENRIKNYYLTMNVNLRRELISMDLPNIFVYQGLLDHDSDMKLYRHILIPNTVKIGMDEDDTIIYPVEELKSNREYRKFYNRVSYRYIEGLSEDCSFSLEGKKLTKVRVVDSKRSLS
jgi:hypothetical protein